MAKHGAHEQRGRVLPAAVAITSPPKHAAVPVHSATYDWGLGVNGAAQRPQRSRFVDVALLLLSIVLVVGGVVYGVTSLRPPAPSGDGLQYVDMAGNVVVPDDTQVQDPSYVQSADPEASSGLRFKIPSRQLDVPLLEANVVDNVINPPGFTAVYQMRNLGVSLADAAKGPVYVAAHSLRPPGEAPGNYVIDPSQGEVVVPIGAEIDVGDHVYDVVSSRIISKPDLAAQTDLWAPTPGMLVFITCLQSTSASGYQADGHAKDNAIIIGRLVS